MVTTFTTLSAAQAAAASYFSTAPVWVVSVHCTIGSLNVVIGRDGTAREA